MKLLKSKIYYATAVSIFGTTGLLLRWTVLPSEIMVLCRGILGALLIFTYTCLVGKRLSVQAIRKNIGWLAFGGISLGLNWVFLFAAYRYTSVAVASLCNYTAPIIVVFLSPLLFHEKLTGKKILCVTASALGIGMLSGILNANQSSIDPVGLLLGMGAALGFVGIILGNKKLSGISPYDRVIVQLLISALTVLPYVLYRNWGQEIPCDIPSIIWMLVLAVIHTAVAYCLYFGSMGELPVQTIALWGYIEPVVSVLCSALILQEPLGIPGALGAVLIIGSAIVSERNQPN